MVLGSTTRKRDRNESNESASHTCAGILNNAPPSNVCGNLGITRVDYILPFGVDLIKGRFFF